MTRCPNKVRYEVMDHLGHFCTESSEHLAEYTPWFIKDGRPDLIDTFGIPLDEYPKRCEEQMANWGAQAESYRTAPRIEVKKSHEFAAEIMNAAVTGSPYVIYGNLPNRGQAPQLPHGAAVETPCLVDRNGVQPSVVDDIPPQLVALMRTQINVQELTVRALMEENVDHLYHAAYMDPHTAAELDLRQIRSLVTDLLAAHGDWMAWRAPEGRLMPASQRQPDSASSAPRGEDGWGGTARRHPYEIHTRSIRVPYAANDRTSDLPRPPRRLGLHHRRRLRHRRRPDRRLPAPGREGRLRASARTPPPSCDEMDAGNRQPPPLHPLRHHRHRRTSGS